MKKPLKILLGGVPFGRNNVGDEAILECTVKIIRGICPEAQITVSTDDGPATEAKLKVRTVELFGFAPPFSRRLMRQTIEAHDVFIWAGATGLSDYPEVPIEMLQIARNTGRTTVVWGVGMNHHLNPFLYSYSIGKRRMLQLLSACTLNQINLVKSIEKWKEQQVRKKIGRALSDADLVVLRDPESRNEVLRCRDIPGLIVGADSALLLEPAALETVNLSDDVSSVLSSGFKKIGICISAQREITDTNRLVAGFNDLVEDDSTRIVFVPMNPLTDSALMAGLRKQMKHPDRSVVVEGRYEPAEILAVAAQLDVVVSSRLHLLILASIVHVPIVGISRGSKVDNFLRPFGLIPTGQVDACNFDRLNTEIRRMLNERPDFELRSRKIRAELLQRLDAATVRLKQILCSAASNHEE
jgi:polysaccharide pyruvyl transferase WcaK-like protein